MANKKSSARYQAEAEADKARSDAKAAEAASKAADAAARTAEANAKAETAKAEAQAKTAEAETKRVEAETKFKEQAEKNRAEEKARADRAARELSPTTSAIATGAAFLTGLGVGHLQANRIEARHVESLKAKQIETANLAKTAKRVLSQRGGVGKAQELAAIGKTARKMGIGNVKVPFRAVAPAVGAMLAEGAIMRFGIAPGIDDPATKEVFQQAGTVGTFGASTLLTEHLVHNATLKFLPNAEHVAAIEAAKEVSSTKARAKAQAGHAKAPVPSGAAPKGQKPVAPEPSYEPKAPRAPKAAKAGAKVKVPKPAGAKLEGLSFMGKFKAPKGLGALGVIAAGAATAAATYDAKTSEAMAEGASPAEARKSGVKEAAIDVGTSVGSGVAVGGIVAAMAKVGVKGAGLAVGPALAGADALHDAYKAFKETGNPFKAIDAGASNLTGDDAAAAATLGLPGLAVGGARLVIKGAAHAFEHAQQAYQHMKQAQASNPANLKGWQNPNNMAAIIANRQAKAKTAVGG